jgi:hypothetical protein
MLNQVPKNISWDFRRIPVPISRPALVGTDIKGCINPMETAEC